MRGIYVFNETFTNVSSFVVKDWFHQHSRVKNLNTAMMRQTSKQILTIIDVRRNFWLRNVMVRVFLVFGLFIGLCSITNALNSRIVTDIVIDPLSGVAINGFDAVSYFTDTEPLRGRHDFEVIWGGVPWLFSSEGNMEIFIKAPEVYAPQYGGHGMMSLARGFLSDGNPQIYKILDNRLYLFYSFSNRAAFVLSDNLSRLNAMNNWADLRVNKGPNGAAQSADLQISTAE